MGTETSPAVPKKYNKTSHILSAMISGLYESTKKGAFWVAIAFYAIAFAIMTKYPDQSIMSLDKIIYGLATITAVFNWGRSTQKEYDDEFYIEQIERLIGEHKKTAQQIEQKNLSDADRISRETNEQEKSLMRQVAVQTGLVQSATLSLVQSLQDTESNRIPTSILPERVKRLYPNYLKAY
jgi:hypothetical protein